MLQVNYVYRYLQWRQAKSPSPALHERAGVRVRERRPLTLSLSPEDVVERENFLARGRQQLEFLAVHARPIPQLGRQY